MRAALRLPTAALATMLIALLAGTPPVRAQVQDLGPTLAAIRDAQHLPGAAAVLLRDGQVLAEGVAGLRRLGERAAIAKDDLFSIGSCTKRMTAFMLARLADEGKLSLGLTLGQALPDVPMRDEYKPVTLAQLLAFTGGIAGYERIGPQITPELFDGEGSLDQRQARFVRHVLQLPPAGAIGKEARYSNASYLLAAYVASRVTGRSYPELMDHYVFRPLGMASAGWGRPWSGERPNAPWRHLARPDGYAPEPDMPRPPEELFMAAGDAHMSVHDLARFAAEDLAAGKGQSKLLSPALAQVWQGINGPAATSAGGRNTYMGGTPWLAACYAVWPQRKLAAALVVNGGTPGDNACKQFLAGVEKDFEKV